MDFVTFTGTSWQYDFDMLHVIMISANHSHSLIKMLYWMCKKAGQQLNWPQMKHAILRNFGGIDETSSFQPLEEFMKVVVLRSVPILENVGLEVSVLGWTYLKRE